MKIVLRNLKSGEMSLQDVPAPQLRAQGVIVKNLYSLISSGTERAQVQMDKKSLLAKAQARPDLVRQVLKKVQSDGLMNTIKAVQNKLGTPAPLGYSTAGVVVEAGEMAGDLRAGDLVACSGGGYACHAEVVYVPRNLAVPVPGDLDPKIAATAGVGAIALQGVRQARANLGETVAVIGLGLLGQLTCQMLVAAGCRVIGIDVNPSAIAHAEKTVGDGLYINSRETDPIPAVKEFTGGLGADATIISAATKDAGPINLSAEITRENGIVSAVGLVNLDVPREAFYHKELQLVVSRSLGPGRYDPSYEEHGLDYPAAYVRWTEGRNMAAYLQLAASGKIDPAAVITGEFPFDQALDAYDAVVSDDRFNLGIILHYDAEKEHPRQGLIPVSSGQPKKLDGNTGIGFIGSGSYAAKFLLPYVKEERLRGIMSSSGSSAVTAAKNYGFETVADSPESLFNDKETSTVFIATRHDTHGELTRQVLTAEKAVFVEKPLCLTMDELRNIVAAYGDSGYLHVGFNRRFAPAVLGALDKFKPTGGFQILCRINAGPLDGHWLQDIAEGGGRILGEGCHFIDLLRFLAGSPLRSVYAASTRPPGTDAIASEDVSITMEFESGTCGTIIYNGSGSKTMTKERYEMFGGGRSVVIDDYQALEVYGSKRETRKFSRRDTGQADQMKAFLAGLRSGSAPIPFNELVESTLATFAVVESLTRRAPVEMTEMWRSLGSKHEDLD